MAPAHLLVCPTRYYIHEGVISQGHPNTTEAINVTRPRHAPVAVQSCLGMISEFASMLHCTVASTQKQHSRRKLQQPASAKHTGGCTALANTIKHAHWWHWCVNLNFNRKAAVERTNQVAKDYCAGMCVACERGPPKDLHSASKQQRGV